MNEILSRMAFALLPDREELQRIALEESGPRGYAAMVLLGKMLEQESWNGIIGMEEDGYPNHPGRKGQRGGSLLKGASSADIRRRARENPNVRNGLDGDGAVYAVGSFERRKLDQHMRRHGREMNFMDRAEYQRSAKEFMESPLTETQEEIFMPDGRRCRIDHATRQIGIVNGTGNLSTFYELNTGRKTTVEQMEEWIKSAREGKNK